MQEKIRDANGNIIIDFLGWERSFLGLMFLKWIEKFEDPLLLPEFLRELYVESWVDDCQSKNDILAHFQIKTFFLILVITKFEQFNHIQNLLI